MYNCGKIQQITILYASTRPGTYAAEERDVLGPDMSKALCEEANRQQISIEELIKRRTSRKVESVVINLPVAEIKPLKKAHEE